MTKRGFRVMDSDLHVIEPADLFDRYLEGPYRGDPPRRESSLVTGTDKWVAQGCVMPYWADMPNFRAANSRLNARKEQTPLQVKAFASGFSPETTLEAMDAEGIDVAVLYRTVAGILIAGSDGLEPAYAVAACRAYNNWLADYCGTDPRRLKGAALIPLHDVDLAIGETRRAVRDLGFIGVCLYPEPLNGRLLYDPEMEPFWSALEDLGVGVGIHGSSFAPAHEDVSRKYLLHPAGRTVTHALAAPMQMMAAIAGLILSGVLDRHPRIRLAFLEAGCAWLPWFLDRLDDQWEKYSDSPLSGAPSSYFQRQCFVSVEPGEVLVQDVVRRVGDGCLIISTDYPHSDSPFPHAIDEFLAIDLADSSRARILWENCARFYGLA